MSGCLVAIVGPSGAGKDSLIRHAQGALASEPGFLFVRRMVTRESNPFEDHDTISEAAFAAGHGSGAFALSWRAHGLGYALPIETVAAIESGTVAVCNLSRGVIPTARARFQRVHVVSVTAPLSILAERLAARGRETTEAVAERLKREAEQEGRIAADFVIQNDAPLPETGGALVACLRGLRPSASPAAP